jgi:hypothetical protein
LSLSGYSALRLHTTNDITKEDFENFSVRVKTRVLSIGQLSPKSYKKLVRDMFKTFAASYRLKKQTHGKEAGRSVIAKARRNKRKELKRSLAARAEKLN